MATNQDNLIWLDMEMSGLLPETDLILELAAVVTDAQLNVIAESPVLVVHQSDAVLDGMDAWNKGTHGRSGLIEKVKASTLDEEAATDAMLSFLKEHVAASKSPMLSYKDERSCWRLTCTSVVWDREAAPVSFWSIPLRR